MKRTIGLLMVMVMVIGLMVSVGCGSDDPTSSSRKLIVGTWEGDEGTFWRFDSDGTTTEIYDGKEYDKSTWSIEGDQLIWGGMIGCNLSVTEDEMSWSDCDDSSNVYILPRK